MKRLLLLGALAATTAGGAWAFYPKVPQANGYMMVISRFNGSGFGSKSAIITISPDGQTQTQELDTKIWKVNKVAGALDQLSTAELRTLNELRATGWHIKTSTPVALGNVAITETVYLLEKE